MSNCLTTIFLVSFIALGNVKSGFTQELLPVLKSNTEVVCIKEGESYYKNIWKISPEVKPDVFVTNTFMGTEKVEFYSDIDTIVFDVIPNRKYDFIILYNNEKAYIQINTDTILNPSLRPKLFYWRKNNINNNDLDSIPFKLGKDNRIHLKGKVNNSDNLDFLFDTGANSCVIVKSIVGDLVNIELNGTSENIGSDGKSFKEKSYFNTIEINGLVWNKVPILVIDYQDPTFDLVLGWNAFENKIVEINYDESILVIHEDLPNLSNEYSKLDFKYIGGVPYVKLILVANNTESEGWFDFDTGYDGNISIGQKFAKEHLLDNRLVTIGSSESSGSKGQTIKSKTVQLPKLKIGDYEMYLIPMDIEESQISKEIPNNFLGNNILKRFNTIIDFGNNAVYLRPNSLYYSSM